MLTLLLAAATPGQAVPPPVSDDIVVMGQRLKRFRFVTKTDRRTGIRRCIVKRSSGDPQLDAYICQGALACARTVQKAEDARPCMEPVFAAVLPKMKWRD